MDRRPGISQKRGPRPKYHDRMPSVQSRVQHTATPGPDRVSLRISTAYGKESNISYRCQWAGWLLILWTAGIRAQFNDHSIRHRRSEITFGGSNRTRKNKSVLRTRKNGQVITRSRSVLPHDPPSQELQPFPIHAINRAIPHPPPHKSCRPSLWNSAANCKGPCTRL